MIVPVSDPWAVALSSTAWLVASLLAGWRAERWSPSRLDDPGPLTRLRQWERGGLFWQRSLRVARWKDRLPEAGALSGRQPRRRIPSRATADLLRFRRETVRAERVHWLIWASTPIHFVWCRPLAAACMTAFGALFNAPFIVIQRYNRGRLDRVLARRAI